jgi:hypothetical protein
MWDNMFLIRGKTVMNINESVLEYIKELEDNIATLTTGILVLGGVVTILSDCDEVVDD